jgi:hypothetical protein
MLSLYYRGMTKNNESIDAAHIHRIASLFNLPEPLECSDFKGKGNINQQTYLVAAGPSDRRTQHLLQLLNPDVFSQPEAVMASMSSCIQAQNEAMAKGVLETGHEWETIQLVPTRTGMSFLEIVDAASGKQCWRMMNRIGNTLAFRSLHEINDPVARLQIAEEAGSGLAIFRLLTAGMDPSQINCPLPGYRDTALYYDQLSSVLAGARTLPEAERYLPRDPLVRQSTERHFLVHLDPETFQRRLDDPLIHRMLSTALEQKNFGLTLARRLNSGELNKVVIHGDTKLDNFLFSTNTGRVKALIDMDTIMPHTWLSDWGDMVRSLVNISGEREDDQEKIQIDMGVYEALVRGFSSATRHIDEHEIELMADAPQIMALELGVRFLADYLRGDSYFKLRSGDSPELNRTRAMVQFCVFKRLRDQADFARRCIDRELYKSKNRG